MDSDDEETREELPANKKRNKKKDSSDNKKSKDSSKGKKNKEGKKSSASKRICHFELVLKESKYASKPSKPASTSYKYVQFFIEGSLKLTGEDKYVEFRQGCMNLIKNCQLVDDACIFHPITPGSKSRDLHLLANVPQDITLQLDYFAVGGGPNSFENKKNYGKGKGQGNKGNNVNNNGLDPIVYLTFKVSCDVDPVTIVNRAVYSWKKIGGIFI